ncbi:MAG: GAF domain-containing protein [Opitutales bacterium]
MKADSATTPVPSAGATSPVHARLLGAVAEAARLLSSTDFDTAMPEVMGLLGEAAGLDGGRVYTYRHLPERRPGWWFDMLYEWTAPGIPRASDIPGRFPFDGADFLDWSERLTRGEAVQALARELGPRPQALQEVDQAKSLLVVPVMVNQVFWGCLGFDDCVEERVWTEPEIATLETAARSVAAAIEREWASEAQQRASALITAIARGSRLLLETDKFDYALESMVRFLGEASQLHGRVYLFRRVKDLERDGLWYDHEHEWVSEGLPRSEDLADRFPMSLDGTFLDWKDRLVAGETVQALSRHLDAPAQAIQERDQAKSLLGVPIQLGDEHWGVIGIDDCAYERVWASTEITALEMAARAIAAGIQRERERTNKERYLALLTGVSEATALLINSEDLALSLETASARIGQASGLDRVYLGEIREADAEVPEPYFYMSHEWTQPGIPMESQGPPGRVRLDRDFPEQMAKLRAGESVNFWRSDLVGASLEINVYGGALALLAIPIMVGGAPVGLFGLDNCTEVRPFTAPELTVAQNMANAIAAALERQRIQDELAEEKARAALAVLEERNRLARDVHDSLAQHFSVASIHLEAAKRHRARGYLDKFDHFIETVHQVVREGSAAARRSVAVLQAPAIENGDLPGALNELCAKIRAHSDLEVTLDAAPGFPALPREHCQHLYRAIQEAIHNALKHSGGRHIWIMLRHLPGNLEIQVGDDGTGFTTDAAAGTARALGFGLNDMRRRTEEIGARLRLTASPEGGALVTIQLPFIVS